MNRCDVALAVEADGVHLGQDDLPLELARRIMGRHKIIGISTHRPEEVTQATQGGRRLYWVRPSLSHNDQGGSRNARGTCRVAGNSFPDRVADIRNRRYYPGLRRGRRRVRSEWRGRRFRCLQCFEH